MQKRKHKFVRFHLVCLQLAWMLIFHPDLYLLHIHGPLSHLQHHIMSTKVQQSYLQSNSIAFHFARARGYFSVYFVKLLRDRCFIIYFKNSKWNMSGFNFMATESQTSDLTQIQCPSLICLAEQIKSLFALIYTYKSLSQWTGCHVLVQYFWIYW